MSKKIASKKAKKSVPKKAKKSVSKKVTKSKNPWAVVVDAEESECHPMVPMSARIGALQDHLCELPDEYFDESTQDRFQKVWGILDDVKRELEYAGL